jgi:GDPmannose 4,6-dehydratase
MSPAADRPRRSLITGATGQDGFYLATLLRDEGHEVWAATRRGGGVPDLPWVQPAPPIDLRDGASLDAAVAAAAPDEVYHLAAQTSVGQSWDEPIETGDATGLGAARVLEAVRRQAPAARVFLASSSEIFGEPERSPQNEATPIRPVSPYAVAKAYAHQMAHLYRARHGLFVAVGILYNHESPRRPPSFVSRKITNGAVAIARGAATELRLGNLEAIRDWGFAGDTVRAMRLMLLADEPDNFVVATGVAHSVRDWCEAAFRRVGLDYRDYVVSDPAFWRPEGPVPLVGDARRAREILGWRPTVDFDDLVGMLVEADLAEFDGRQGRAGDSAAEGVAQSSG